MNISKELLSLILKYDVQKFTIRDNNIIPFQRNKLFKDAPNVRSPINLDSLGRLCKEWCFEQDYLLSSSKYDIDDWVCYVDYDCEDTNKAYRGMTETEAIIKATEFAAKEQGLL